jgi:hypothetical protein
MNAGTEQACKGGGSLAATGKTRQTKSHGEGGQQLPQGAQFVSCASEEHAGTYRTMEGRVPQRLPGAD